MYIYYFVSFIFYSINNLLKTESKSSQTIVRDFFILFKGTEPIRIINISFFFMFILYESSIKTREIAVYNIHLWFYDFGEKQNKTKSSYVKEIYLCNI